MASFTASEAARTALNAERYWFLQEDAADEARRLWGWVADRWPKPTALPPQAVLKLLRPIFDTDLTPLDASTLFTSFAASASSTSSADTARPQAQPALRSSELPTLIFALAERVWAAHAAHGGGNASGTAKENIEYQIEIVAAALVDRIVSFLVAEQQRQQAAAAAAASSKTPAPLGRAPSFRRDKDGGARGALVRAESSAGGSRGTSTAPLLPFDLEEAAAGFPDRYLQPAALAVMLHYDAPLRAVFMLFAEPQLQAPWQQQLAMRLAAAGNISLASSAAAALAAPRLPWLQFAALANLLRIGEWLPEPVLQKLFTSCIAPGEGDTLSLPAFMECIARIADIMHEEQLVRLQAAARRAHAPAQAVAAGSSAPTPPEPRLLGARRGSKPDTVDAGIEEPDFLPFTDAIVASRLPWSAARLPGKLYKLLALLDFAAALQTECAHSAEGAADPQSSAGAASRSNRPSSAVSRMHSVPPLFETAPRVALGREAALMSISERLPSINSGLARPPSASHDRADSASRSQARNGSAHSRPRSSARPASGGRRPASGARSRPTSSMREDADAAVGVYQDDGGEEEDEDDAAGRGRIVDGADGQGVRAAREALSAPLLQTVEAYQHFLSATAAAMPDVFSGLHLGVPPLPLRQIEPVPRPKAKADGKGRGPQRQERVQPDRAPIFVDLVFSPTEHAQRTNYRGELQHTAAALGVHAVPAGPAPHLQQVHKLITNPEVLGGGGGKSDKGKASGAKAGTAKGDGTATAVEAAPGGLAPSEAARAARKLNDRPPWDRYGA